MMIIYSPLDEVRKREKALKIINAIIKKHGRRELYDLTGLAGGFLLKKEDIDILETYAGPALFEDQIEKLGKRHLGGERILTFNRTTSAILATILALVQEGEVIVHYLPKLPSHPSIPQSAKLVKAIYREFDDIDKFEVDGNTSLVIITGSTMDHDIVEQKHFLKIIEISAASDIPVLVDDASGARLRTIIYKQPRAMDMGADMVITSTDKLMDGPRGGLMAGKKEIMGMVKSKAHQFGLEAQPPLVAGMVRALEYFNSERILKAFNKKIGLYKSLKLIINSIVESPTGIMLSAEDLVDELKQRGVETLLSPKELTSIFSMLLLIDYHIVTIPAVGMPGTSPTIRIDLASKDAELVDTDYLVKAFSGTFSKMAEIVVDVKACESVLYG